MAYSVQLADKVRAALSGFQEFRIEEKRLFGGLAFLVNEKMCINVSGDKLMCRFDPVRTPELSERPGFLPMVMRGRVLKGYCYVDPLGYKSKTDFMFWLNCAIEFNKTAQSSKKTG